MQTCQHAHSCSENHAITLATAHTLQRACPRCAVSRNPLCLQQPSPDARSAKSSQYHTVPLAPVPKTLSHLNSPPWSSSEQICFMRWMPRMPITLALPLPFRIAPKTTDSGS
jgi:hypothetical protein